MKSLLIKPAILICSIAFLNSCSLKDKNVLIDENFDNNELRWIEEETQYHSLELKNGKYHIHAKDTIRQTSSAPYNRTYLYNLKENFSVTFKIDLLGRDIDSHSRAGIMLTCASMDYRIYITNKSEIVVSEELYADRKEIILLSKFTDNDITNSPQEIKVFISGYKGNIIYNKREIGEFELKSKALDGIRIFTSPRTSIDVYNIKVQNI
ncbi:hypothetical protein [Flexithrix dorotheae]|uniref:hypothetical protein n=1 Tax=Flexithrix dorotheae TaxID=70993 RepID=UPI0003636524|nr:hypothetical protein [Flexithrix dorotheae]